MRVQTRDGNKDRIINKDILISCQIVVTSPLLHNPVQTNKRKSSKVSGGLAARRRPWQSRQRNPGWPWIVWVRLYWSDILWSYFPVVFPAQFILKSLDIMNSELEGRYMPTTVKDIDKELRCTSMHLKWSENTRELFLLCLIFYPY